jgi:L-iditol 2-dehydrogenase
MRAALLKAPGKLVITEVPKPECPAGGLLVKIEACSICTTDVKMFYRGQRDLIYPRILGHEIAGMIVGADTDDNSFKKGDEVQIAPGISCGKCPYCQQGATNQCERIGIFGFIHHGGFAQYLAVPPESIRCKGVNLIPEGLTFEEATLAEPLACCLNGLERVGLTDRDTVLIFGAGPIGCLHAMLARALGAKRILLAERSLERIKMASGAKADRLISTSKEDIKDVVKEETEGRGVDIILLDYPESAVDYPILDLLAPRGRVCFFSGLPVEKSQIHLDANQLHYREITYVGAYGCTAEQNRKALTLMASKQVNAGWLITKKISLEEIHEGFDRIINQRGMKVVITEF